MAEEGFLSSFMGGLMSELAPGYFQLQARKQLMQQEAAIKQEAVDRMASANDPMYDEMIRVETNPMRKAILNSQKQLGKTHSLLLADIYPNVLQDTYKEMYDSVQPSDTMKNIQSIQQLDPEHYNNERLAQITERHLVKPLVENNFGEKPMLTKDIIDRAYGPSGEPVKSLPPVMTPKQLSDSGITFGSEHPKEDTMQKVDPTIVAKYAENAATLKQIERGLEFVKKKPDAFGAQNYAYYFEPAANVLNALRPGDTEAVSTIAGIGSAKRHEVSGATVTYAERPDLLPFLPNVRSDGPTNEKRLLALKKQYEDSQAGFEKYYNPSNGFKDIKDLSGAVENAIGQESNANIKDFTVNRGQFIYTPDMSKRINKGTKHLEVVDPKDGSWNEYADTSVDESGNLVMNNPQQEKSAKTIVKQMKQKSTGRIVNIYSDGSKEYADAPTNK